MRARIYNTFFKILNNRCVANILTVITYNLLIIGYFLVRPVIKNSKKVLIEPEEARVMLNKCNPKPNMVAKPINREVKKELSIIIPAYNVEKTIKKCIESVVEQETDVDYEVIVVNDGSTDNTRSVIEQYNNSKIKLINQKNCGLSGARNRGIDECVGEYAMFLDSDDYLVGNCIQKMMDSARKNDADIVQGSYFTFVDNNETSMNKFVLSDKILTETKDSVANPGFAWGKIFKREMWNEIRFPLGVWYEDTIMCTVMFRMCRKMVVLSDMIYAYRINPYGITNNARQSKKCIDHYWVMEFSLELAKKMGLKNDIIQYELVMGHMTTLLYRRISLMDEQTIKCAFILACELMDEIRPTGYICNGRRIQKDLETAFRTKNYKLWKLASFIV